MTNQKTITVPLMHYLVLASAGFQKISYYLAHDDDAGKNSADFANLIRWDQWHNAAEERGLTRP